ncbi:MAG: hypothetical protein R3313_02755 [Candidatus Saccharimonadales bacterium]|nr:hypothetical protein [Candidatus Saccharimonadales bacterium]
MAKNKSSHIEDRLTAIEERNKRVEADKAWETSLVRIAIITMLTYVIVYVYLRMIDADQAAASAIVPALGFFLSTLIVRSVKQVWLRKKGYK